MRSFTRLALSALVLLSLLPISAYSQSGCHDNCLDSNLRETSCDTTDLISCLADLLDAISDDSVWPGQCKPEHNTGEHHIFKDRYQYQR